MYENIGEKIKVLAKVIGILLLIAGIIAWFILITNKTTFRSGEQEFKKADDWIGWVSLVSGICGYFYSWFTYGFGQLIEDTGTIRFHLTLNKNQRPVSNTVTPSTVNSPSATGTYVPTWLRDSAKPQVVQYTQAAAPAQPQVEPSNASFCTNCGAALNENAAFCTSCGKKRNSTLEAPDFSD